MIHAIITTSFEGIHNYPEATGDEQFLSNPHRHIFHVRVKIEQFHNDRDVEYVKFKRWIDTILPSGDVGTSSCEKMARELMVKIQMEHPNRNVSVSVLEDNENGAEVTT